MAITLDGTSGITTPDITSTAGFDSADLTGDIAAARITTALNATGSAPIYACRAWVNFNGTGTVAIRASGNVSSITDNSTGDYTVNFTTAMPDANYCFLGIGRNTATLNSRGIGSVTSKTTSGFRFETVYVSTLGGNGGLVDEPQVDVAIFR
jgi:hypothetical protein